MSIKKIITGFTLSLLLASVVSVAANYDSANSTSQSRNYEAAFKKMLPLAEQGNIDAQKLIGLMYDIGRGVPEDDKLAVKWFTKAANKGDRIPNSG